MEGNKDEALHCISLAEKCVKEKNREKAERFLLKAEKLFPTQKAKGKHLLSKYLFNMTMLIHVLNLK